MEKSPATIVDGGSNAAPRNSIGAGLGRSARSLEARVGPSTPNTDITAPRTNTGPAARTAISLDLPADLSFEEWTEIGLQLSHAAGSLAWWIGDWWAYGERGYGERAQAVHELDLDLTVETCKNYGWVASRFETSRRRDLLSFKHHQEVAPLEPEAADALLDWCEEPIAESGRPHSVRELREERRRRATRPTKPPDDDDDDEDDAEPDEQPDDEDEDTSQDDDSSKISSSAPDEIAGLVRRTKSVVMGSAETACQAALQTRARLEKLKARLTGDCGQFESEFREFRNSADKVVSAWQEISKALATIRAKPVQPITYVPRNEKALRV